MHRRLSGFERRLARLAARLRDWAGEADAARALHDGRRAVAAMIRTGLERAGLDPGAAVTLRRYEALEPPAPPPRPAPRPVGPGDALLAEIARLVERTRGSPPPLATASPLALLAYYCFGDGAEPAPA